MSVLWLFFYLQLLDFLTTVLFLKMGLHEASWLVASLVRWSPMLGVMVAKLGTIALAAIAVRYHKDHLIRAVNVGYGGIVAWNLFCMIVAKPV